MVYKIFETLHYEGKEYTAKEDVFTSESEALNEYIDRGMRYIQIYDSYESWEENSHEKGLTHWFTSGAITLQLDLVPTIKKRAIRK